MSGMTEFEFELRGAENLLERIAERFVKSGYSRESRILANCASVIRNVHDALPETLPSAMTGAREEGQCSSGI